MKGLAVIAEQELRDLWIGGRALLLSLASSLLLSVLAYLVATNGPILAIVGFAMIAASGSTFFYPAMGAYLPSLAADERQLGPANSAGRASGTSASSSGRPSAGS